MKASTYWRIVTVVSAAFTVIVALGEWVFHWWSDPGQWLALLGVLVTIAAAGISATSTDVDRHDERQTASFERLGQQQRAGFERLIAGQAEQTRILEEHTRILREMLQSFRARSPAGLGPLAPLALNAIAREPFSARAA